MYPHDNMTLEPVELGASIFVAVNKNMMRASDEFNLTRIKFAADDNEQMGIWDGKEFLFTVSDLAGSPTVLLAYMTCSKEPKGTGTLDRGSTH